MGKGLLINRQFSKEDIHMANMYMKGAKHHESPGNANQNHNEISSHTSEPVHYQKDKR